jgi:hypothetical protein
MIDAFCELIASLNFPCLVCLFLGFYFPLILPWKPNKIKGKQRKPEENHRIRPAPNQRKAKETKGNRRKRKQIKGFPAVKNACSSDLTKELSRYDFQILKRKPSAPILPPM